MYPATPTFWLTRTGLVAIGLRRYSRRDTTGWTCADGYHSALRYTSEAPAAFREKDGRRYLAEQPPVPHDDPAWPGGCRCGYEFTDDDPWQDWQREIYQRDTGDRHTIGSVSAATVGGPPPAPPGAMWDAWWSWRTGADGIALTVRCPNGHDWSVDERASNCTLPADDVHRCWVRHGDPRTEPVTVDKNGVTCSAGAGSILAGGYHGFLSAGVLTAG